MTPGVAAGARGGENSQAALELADPTATVAATGGSGPAAPRSTHLPEEQEIRKTANANFAAAPIFPRRREIRRKFSPDIQFPGLPRRQTSWCKINRHKTYSEAPTKKKKKNVHGVKKKKAQQ